MSAMAVPKVKALIFDFDGLIVDTETSIYIAWKELYASQGQELSLSDYVRCVGSTFAQYNPQTVLQERCDHQIEWEPLIAVKDARIHELLDGQPALPGVEDLLQCAQSNGIPCAVASSSEASWVKPWLTKLGLLEAFDSVHTRCQGHPAKPAPDLFLSAARGLDIAPADTLIFEDSSNGLIAAGAAGAPCWIVPNQITQCSDFSAAQRILGSLVEVNLAEMI
ncbi:MAG: putative hydrolase of the HAD superfamily [Verrucomicrobiales bacterium]|jgi:putative hydrolase of the HAD superfamily